MAHALRNMNMAVSNLMLTIKLIYFHQLSNCFNTSRKLYQKMSHGSRNVNMAVSYQMLTSIIKWFEFSKTTISQNVTDILLSIVKWF